MDKKNIIILVVVVVLIIIVGLVLVVFGKYSSPQRTLNQMVRAMEKGDIDAYLECLTESSQKILIDAGIKDQNPEDLKKGAENYKEADFEVIEKTKDTAVMKSETEGELVFKKEKGGWKVDLEATFKKMFEQYAPVEE